MQKLLIIAALAATSLAQPALADPAPANPTVVVRHNDLDLRTEAGTTSLKHRIRHAVAAVCGTASDFDLEGKNDVRHCRRDTMRLASAQAATVIADAAQSQPIRLTASRK